MAAVKTHEYKVAMTCQGCAGAVERVLGKLKDTIEDVKIDLDSKVVKVKTALPSETVMEVLKKTGKDVEYIASS